jgi:hypothetical protein
MNEKDYRADTPAGYDSHTNFVGEPLSIQKVFELK